MVKVYAKLLDCLETSMAEVTEWSWTLSKGQHSWSHPLSITMDMTWYFRVSLTKFIYNHFYSGVLASIWAKCLHRHCLAPTYSLSTCTSSLNAKFGRFPSCVTAQTLVSSWSTTWQCMNSAKYCCQRTIYKITALPSLTFMRCTTYWCNTVYSLLVDQIRHADR